MSGSQNGVIQAHSKDAPAYYPVGLLNGYLREGVRKPPPDLDTSPIEFRRFVNASGAQDVQLNNGLNRRIGSGLRVPFVSYLYAIVPSIPGQMRDDYGGKHKHGIGPLEYQNLVKNGPGSQPTNPGGVRQMMGNQFFNPGTS